MIQEELDQILDLHSKWLNEEPGGERADLSEETLAGTLKSGGFFSKLFGN